MRKKGVRDSQVGSKLLAARMQRDGIQEAQEPSHSLRTGGPTPIIFSQSPTLSKVADERPRSRLR